MQFEVDRFDPTKTRVVEEPIIELTPGRAKLAIERFGLSANNISYHSLGDAMGYWKLFPSHDVESPWRRIPVWAVATVVESAHDDLAVGGRFFGLFPMGDSVVVEAADVRTTSFRDAALHRQDVMAPVWNHYTVLPGDTESTAEERSWNVLLRPLAITGYLVGDHLAEHGCFGADTVVLSSASSKTALMTAFFLRSLGAPRVVGLTSPGNRQFVLDTGAFDQVETYGDLDHLNGKGFVFLDYAGNITVRAGVVDACGTSLVKHFAMGMAQAPDLGQLMDTSSLGGPPPELFPAQLAVTSRRRELGGEEYDLRTVAAMSDARSWTNDWLAIIEGQGMDAVEGVYRSLLAGDVSPNSGHVLLPC